MPPRVDPDLRMAAERTLLAWVRTGLSLIAFGFLIDRFGLFIRAMARAGGQVAADGNIRYAFIIALLVIGVGVGFNLLAAMQYRRVLAVAPDDPMPSPIRWSLPISLAYFVSFLGLLTGAYLVALNG